MLQNTLYIFRPDWRPMSSLYGLLFSPGSRKIAWEISYILSGSPPTFVRAIRKIGEKPSTARGRNQTGSRDNRRILFSSGVLCFQVFSIKLQRLLARFPRAKLKQYRSAAPRKINSTYSSVRPFAGSAWKFRRGTKEKRPARILKHKSRVDVQRGELIVIARYTRDAMLRRTFFSHLLFSLSFLLFLFSGDHATFSQRRKYRPRHG